MASQAAAELGLADKLPPRSILSIQRRRPNETAGTSKTGAKFNYYSTSAARTLVQIEMFMMSHEQCPFDLVGVRVRINERSVGVNPASHHYQ